MTLTASVQLTLYPVTQDPLLSILVINILSSLFHTTTTWKELMMNKYGMTEQELMIYNQWKQEQKAMGVHFTEDEEEGQLTHYYEYTGDMENEQTA